MDKSIVAFIIDSNELYIPMQGLCIHPITITSPEPIFDACRELIRLWGKPIKSWSLIIMHKNTTSMIIDNIGQGAKYYVHEDINQNKIVKRKPKLKFFRQSKLKPKRKKLSA